jgi:transposase
LQPRRSQSGESDPQSGISKAGNRYLRMLLVQSAHYTLGHFGADNALRQWGIKLASRGGKNAKKRAIVAVARKLAILLHQLLVSQEEYAPFYGVRQQAA